MKNLESLLKDVTSLELSVIGRKADIGTRVSQLQEKLELTNYRVCKEAEIQPKQLHAIKAGENYDITTLIKVVSVLKANILIR